MDMTPAARAREIATHFEAKKTGFGQAQDGWSLTLRIQDADVPAFVRDAKKGTRFMIALVEIGDDEQPISHSATPGPSEDRPGPAPQPTIPMPVRAEKEKRKFDALPCAQQAGILCGEQAFKKYLFEKFPKIWNETLQDPGATVREICKVDSRADIKPDNPMWSALVLDYRIWQREPEFIGAA